MDEGHAVRSINGEAVFHDGTRIAYQPPANTLDPRYLACTEHRVACDCREAEYNEDIAEYQGDWRMFQKVMAEVLADHIGRCCQCTGCQIARRLHLTSLTKGSHSD